MATGYDYSWFVLTQKIIEKEFALSGSEQNPDLTGKDVSCCCPGPARRTGPGGGVRAARRRLRRRGHAERARRRDEQAHRADRSIDADRLQRLVEARDREMANAFSKDAQVTAIRGARSYRGDKLIRVASPHRLLDPEAGPLIAVRLNILTRKTLGGLQTDLQGRVLGRGGDADARRVRRR